MQTDELVAGRELNALVAEKVMRWIIVPYLGWCDLVDGDTRSNNPYEQLRYVIRAKENWSPSTDMVAAWQVVERVWQEEWVLRRFLGSWQILDGDPLDNHRVLASADAAPLAICKAALQALAT